MHHLRVFVGSVLTACLIVWTAQPLAAEEPEVGLGVEVDAPDRPAQTWIDGLKAGIRKAQTERKPLLVFAGSETCPWCRRLKAELDAEPLARELKGWILAYVEVDRRSGDARELAIGPVPALRILNVRGIRVASLEGLPATDQLIGWLRKHHEQATQSVDPTLLESGEPNVLAIVRLVRQLDQPDPTQREAAVQRLTANRAQAASAVLKAFRDGNLATRLAVLEILHQWQAPIDGLDPWQPETITPTGLARLDEWRKLPFEAPAEPAKTLSEDELAKAREQIDRLLKSEGVLAAAIRGRLARCGPALLPEVYERLKNTVNDQQRERLLALRYRLVASDSLVVRWPGGIVRLASSEVDQRRKAAEQLAELATAEDQALLLELFSDSDSLIRELSLRSLDHLGGTESRASLARLLNDPEPNVRAAVLKRLAEDAPVAMVGQVAEYVKNEQDPDLLVHAIRYFKATAQANSLEALLPLLKHESWQVRAEAAEAIGSAAEDLEPNLLSGGIKGNAIEADAYAALIDLLADPDAFVVSRAVEGLSGADMAIAVEPLVNAALTHVDLAPQIVMMLAGGEEMRAKALPHLQKFRTHETPEIRAAALQGLFRVAPNTISESLGSGLRDDSRVVRLAAAEVIGTALEKVRQAERQKIIEERLGRNQPTFDASYLELEPVVRESFATRALKALFGGTGTKDKEPELDVLEDPGPETVPTEKVTPETEPTETGPPGEPSADSTEPPASVPTENGERAAQESNDTEDADVAADEAGRHWDQWLAEFRTGDKRPGWTDDIDEPLVEMSTADDSSERAAAARLLVMLGDRESAMQILRELSAAQPHQSISLVKVLPWLTWQEREPLFDQLMSESRSDEERQAIIGSMAQVLDSRAAARFWTLLEAPNLSQDMAETLDNALASAYVGESYYVEDIESVALRREIVAAAKPRAESGPDLQRLVALVMLARVDSKQAAPVARQIADDQTSGTELRRDAFQISLAISTSSARKKAAAAALAGDDATRRLVAIRYLVGDDDDLGHLRGYSFNVPVDDSQSTYLRSSTPIIPAAPKEIEREVLLPLLEHEDLEIRAFAAYLLALLEDPQGMPKLIEYWKERPDDEARMKLVYRAIAVLDDPSYLPVLREIYKKLEGYYVSEFYWTIRIMSGPEVLSFRKQIRDEVGVDNL